MNTEEQHIDESIVPTTGQWWRKRHIRFNQIVAACAAAALVCYTLILCAHVAEAHHGGLLTGLILMYAFANLCMLLLWLVIANVLYVLCRLLQLALPEHLRPGYAVPAWRTVTAICSITPGVLVWFMLSSSYYSI